MTPEERAREIARTIYDEADWDSIMVLAPAAIAAAIREAEAAAYERAAQVVEAAPSQMTMATTENVASAIRKLKGEGE